MSARIGIQKGGLRSTQSGIVDLMPFKATNARIDHKQGPPLGGLLKAISVFDDFCNANDPYEEHDFGAFEA